MKKILICVMTIIILSSFMINKKDYDLTVNNIVEGYSEKFNNIINHMDEDIDKLKIGLENGDIHIIIKITDDFLKEAYEIDKDDVLNQNQLTQFQIVIENYEVLYRIAKENKISQLNNAYISLVNSINDLKNML